MEVQAHLCIGKNFRRNDFIRAKCLLWIYEGSKNLACLLAFAWLKRMWSAHVISVNLRGRWMGPGQVRTAQRRRERIVYPERHIDAAQGVERKRGEQ